jgi:hypothetical protein
MERTNLLTWQLQQIVPEAARGVGSSMPPSAARCALTE